MKTTNSAAKLQILHAVENYINQIMTTTTYLSSTARSSPRLSKRSVRPLDVVIFFSNSCSLSRRDLRRLDDVSLSLSRSSFSSAKVSPRDHLAQYIPAYNHNLTLGRAQPGPKRTGTGPCRPLVFAS